MRPILVWGTVPFFIVFIFNSAFSAERQIMMPRVPSDQIEQARALVSPLPDSDEIVQQGKVLFEGKGTCFNCHGLTGRGDGPGGKSLDPSPRNFQRRGMWHHRTEGEIFWVIKHGSPGTGMIPFGGLLTDEEIWTVMQYERNFAERGRGMGRMGEGRGGPGMHKGMGEMGRHGRGMGGMMQRRGMEPMEQGMGECCEKNMESTP